jgi:hypothetical protein
MSVYKYEFSDQADCMQKGKGPGRRPATDTQVNEVRAVVTSNERMIMNGEFDGIWNGISESLPI